VLGDFSAVHTLTTGESIGPGTRGLIADLQARVLRLPAKLQ